MAYASNDLRLIGGYPGQQLFLYKTADDLATTVASGYFDDAAEDYNLGTGDIVLAVTGTNAAVDVLVINSIGPVTVVNGS
ncbi:hypothetical protein [Salidesulfovibrio brasiliensis]|uniref:hypothetical protein n=1 Tax=Salidesulfovibrio brasiliensis TaxID=221711 RepID=UPI0006CF350F|nr:hypothetical protein [Salidesulfovibrio brasiliensis]